jgi:nucleotide-binding universal stress UspA family protein
MRILCGTDLLPKSDSALDRAGMLAKQLGAALTLLHVVPLTESERMLEQDIERARERLDSLARPPLWRHGRAPRVCVRTGRAARVLIDTATELGADLIVLGTHRRRLVGDALAGTIAQRLLSELRCPVLSVRRMPWHAYRNVLFALNHSKASANAVRAAEELVLAESTRASVVHAYRPPYEEMVTLGGVAWPVADAYLEGGRKEHARASLHDLLERASSDPSRYELILENATPATAVQHVVSRLKPDLLVVGTRGRGRWNRALLGSVASQILSRAKLDVLAVPDRFVRRAGQVAAESQPLRNLERSAHPNA